jgi:hypothetical protein
MSADGRRTGPDEVAERALLARLAAAEPRGLKPLSGSSSASGRPVACAT